MLYALTGLRAGTTPRNRAARAYCRHPRLFAPGPAQHAVRLARRARHHPRLITRYFLMINREKVPVSVVPFRATILVGMVLTSIALALAPGALTGTFFGRNVMTGGGILWLLRQRKMPDGDLVAAIGQHARAGVHRRHRRPIRPGHGQAPAGDGEVLRRQLVTVLLGRVAAVRTNGTIVGRVRRHCGGAEQGHIWTIGRTTNGVTTLPRPVG